MLDDPEYHRWQRSADDAQGAAMAQEQAGYPQWSCFLAEEAAQLAVKGLLHGAGQGAWGNDLVELGRRASVVAGTVPATIEDAPIAPAPIEDAPIEDALRRLSRHYLPARYPDANPGGTPGEHYGPSDAAQALDDLVVVRRFVDRTWTALEEAADGPS